MKRYCVSILMVICLGTFSWAQGAKELFDAKKSQEELEIMKGILGTTMSFVAQNLQKQAATTGTAATPKTATVWSTSSFRISNISAFYLYGQGAVFVIPGSSFRFGSTLGALGAYNLDMAATLEAANANLAGLSKDMARAAAEVDRAAVEAGVRGAVAGGVQGGASAPPAIAKAQTAKPAQSAQTQEEFQKKLAEQLEKAKKSREDMRVSREKLQVFLVEMKGYLIEALANYGDSLTTVKPNEYINVVITTEDSNFGWALNGESDASSREVISVQKSWITDYKAGRLNLDAFKQKALQYKQ